MNLAGSRGKADNSPVVTKSYTCIDNVYLTGSQVGEEGFSTPTDVSNYNWHSYQVMATGRGGESTGPSGIFKIQTTNGTAFGDHYTAQISNQAPQDNPSGLLYSDSWYFDKARVSITGASGYWTIIEKHAAL